MDSKQLRGVQLRREEAIPGSDAAVYVSLSWKKRFFFFFFFLEGDLFTQRLCQCQMFPCVDMQFLYASLFLT